MFLVEAWKKLKQKEVGCSIWQSMQSRRLLQQWWNYKKRYKNSFSKWDFPVCSHIWKKKKKKKAFAFICSFLFYLHQWHEFLQTVDLNLISHSNCLVKGPKFRNNVDIENLISLFVLCHRTGFLSCFMSFLKRYKMVLWVHLWNLSQNW